MVEEEKYTQMEKYDIDSDTERRVRKRKKDTSDNSYIMMNILRPDLEFGPELEEKHS